MSPVQVCINLCLKLALGLAEIFPLICTSWATAPGDPRAQPRAGRNIGTSLLSAEEEEVSGKKPRGPRVLSRWLVQSPHVLRPRKVSIMRRSTIPPQRADNHMCQLLNFCFKKRQGTEKEWDGGMWIPSGSIPDWKGHQSGCRDVWVLALLPLWVLLLSSVSSFWASGYLVIK